MNTIKNILNTLNDLYDRYLIRPIIVMCVFFLIYYTIVFDVSEMILWGGLLGINLFNSYMKHNR